MPAHPEWLPHVLTVSGPVTDVSAFRRAASGPGIIPWAVDYDRLQEDWVNALLTPPPSERGISVEGARVLAAQLRERLEQQDQRAAEAAVGSRACPLDLDALVPVPARILRLGPDDPAAVAWLWETGPRPGRFEASRRSKPIMVSNRRMGMPLFAIGSGRRIGHPGMP